MKNSSPFPQATNYSLDNINPLFQSWGLCPPLLTLHCPEDFRNYSDSVSYSNRNCLPHITVPFSYDSFSIKATQAFWATEQGNRELCCQQRKQQANKRIFPSYTAVHSISFEPSRSRSSSGESSDTFAIMIKESLRLSLQSCIAWDSNNCDCWKHSQPDSKFSQLLGGFFVLVHFLLSEKTTIWQKCIVTLCNDMSMVSLVVSVWLQILPNMWTIWSLRSFLIILNYFWYFVNLLTIKCFQDRSSLITYSMSHTDFYLLCQVLIYNDIRKNIFLCYTPDAVSLIFIKVVISLFSSILLAIFLLIPAVHCRY